MRILILGNDYSAQSFFELFSADKNNIVFKPSTDPNFPDLSNPDDIKDFIEANDIDFVLLTNEEHIISDTAETIVGKDTTIFAPSADAVEISYSKAEAKRFMYKNNIPTPAFQIFDRLNSAYDYVKDLKNPVAIKPDVHNKNECTQFAETSTSAKKIINNLFKSGNEKIIVEDYIEGKNIQLFILCDGFKFHILGISAKYQNNVAYFEPEFLSDDIVERIIEEVISPTTEALEAQGGEYIGILGFDLILKRDNSFVLVGYNSFFDDIDVDFYTKGFDVDWLKIFESTIVGDVFLKYEIYPKNVYMATIRQKENIEFISAKTKGNLEIYISELCDDSEYKEAVKIWNS